MTTRPVKRPCALCGRMDVPERMTYSAHTGNRYCIDTAACDRRRRTRKKVSA